jgi:hypothetical protein
MMKLTFLNLRYFYLTSVAGGHPRKREMKPPSVPAWFSDNYSTSDVDSVLESIKRMECSVCGLKLRKDIASASRFSRHFSTHLEKSVPCSFCKKKFSNDDTLQKHVKRRDHI